MYLSNFQIRIPNKFWPMKFDNFCKKNQWAPSICEGSCKKTIIDRYFIKIMENCASRCDSHPWKKWNCSAIFKKHLMIEILESGKFMTKQVISCRLGPNPKYDSVMIPSWFRYAQIRFSLLFKLAKNEFRRFLSENNRIIFDVYHIIEMANLL
jgi:hypothetical protein